MEFESSVTLWVDCNGIHHIQEDFAVARLDYLNAK